MLRVPGTHHVGQSDTITRSDQRDVERGLQGRLVPAGEAAARVCRLELCGRRIALLATRAGKQRQSQSQRYRAGFGRVGKNHELELELVRTTS